MNDRITVTGIVATNPRHIVTKDGGPVTSFRLASEQTPEKVNGVARTTNWYSVHAEGRLAENMVRSLDKGHRVIVVGTIEIGGANELEVVIHAHTAGHDLAWGTGQFTRTIPHTNRGIGTDGPTDEEGSPL